VANPPKKRGLGRGLGALMGDVANEDAQVKPAVKSAQASAAPQALSDGTRLLMIDPTTIKPNPKQPRHVFNEEALEELCESIKRDGIQEPVIVREVGGGYELVSGERRVRASVMADLREIPAVCREISDRDMLKLGLIENIQREDLNAIECARAYKDLIDEFGWTQEQCADQVGKRRATVANTLRLLNLPDEVQDMLSDNTLSMGHAKALLSLKTPAAQRVAARKAVNEGLSVRQVEQMGAAKTAKAAAAFPAKAKDPNITSLENELRRHLGAKVSITPTADGRGKVEIEYYNNDDLDRVINLLKGKQR